MDRLDLLPCTWRGLGATLVRGPALEAVITTIGAQLACLRAPGERLNPLWQPPWPSCLPDAAGPAHGGPADRPLHAVICGSNLCLDRFGPAWPGEDRPLHGEAGVSRWRMQRDGDAATWRTWLPLARLHAERRIAIAGTTLTLTTRAWHDGSDPRPVEWCEHTTLGPPFLDGARFAAGIDAAWTAPWAPDPGWRFPGTRLAEVDPSAALAMPGPQAPPCGDVLSARVAQGWWTAEHPLLGRRLRVAFAPEAFPFLALWTQHRSRTAAPWNGIGRARGMELTTKPFPEGCPPPERAERFAGRPTRCLIPPGAHGLAKTVRFTWERC